MHWPFVSRARFDLMQHNFDELRKALHEERATRFRDGTTIERQHEWMREMAARYDALLEKYHALRPTHSAAEPHAPVVTSPMADLGPLTRAALAEMANGQSGAVVRAMRNKALALWLEYRGDERQDAKVAHAVYRGEAVNLT